MGYLYETHMHTSQVSGCAVATAARQVRSFKEKGYAGIIVTDHFVNGYSTCPQHLSWEDKMKHLMSGYAEARIEGDKCGLDVFFGWEFTYRGSDFLTYGLGPDFLAAHPNLDRLPIEEYSEVVRNNGGYLAQAHPYRDDWYVEYRFPVDHWLIDGVEIYNSSEPEARNAKALAFAKLHGLPMQSGSDCHGRSALFPAGVMLSDKADSIFDIIEAIKSRQAVLITPDSDRGPQGSQ